MQIHRAFWIKLARLASLLDQIEEERAELHNMMRDPDFVMMHSRFQDGIRKVARCLDDIAHLD